MGPKSQPGDDLLGGTTGRFALRIFLYTVTAVVVVIGGLILYSIPSAKIQVARHHREYMVKRMMKLIALHPRMEGPFVKDPAALASLTEKDPLAEAIRKEEVAAIPTSGTLLIAYGTDAKTLRRWVDEVRNRDTPITGGRIVDVWFGEECVSYVCIAKKRSRSGS